MFVRTLTFTIIHIGKSSHYLSDLPFSQIFRTIDSLPASGLTPQLYDWTISSEHLGFYF